MSTELISLIANLVLGGGLIVTLVTLRSTKQKAAAEAKGMELANEEKSLEIQGKYIVEPLKKEINALRKDVRKLQKAIDAVGACPHADNCPVRNRMQEPERDEPDGEPTAAAEQ